MKTKIIFTLFISLTLFPLFNSIYCQGFKAVTIPDETHVVAAGDSGKIYLSYDSGLSWNIIPSYIVDFNSISSGTNYTYLTAYDSKVYRVYIQSINPVNVFTISGNYKFNSVCFLSDSTGFICGDNGAVFKTLNRGVNWNSVNSGIADLKLNSISFKDINNGVIAADGGIIFITSNGGSKWFPATPVPLTSNNLLKVKYFADGITAAGDNGALIIKKNDSPDWKYINTKVSSRITGIAGAGIDDVHVCGGGGFIRNNKNGSEGFTNFEPNPMIADLADISMLDSKTGFAVSSLNKALIKTTNGGESWNFTNGVYATYNWEKKAASSVTGGNYGNTLCRHPYNKNTFFCGQGSRVFVSRNGGDNWTDIAGVPGTSMHSLYISPLDTNIWMCAIKGTPNRIMRTTNYGQNWTTSIGMTFSSFGQPLEMDQNNPSVYYFAPDGGGFYRSTDNGINFELISTFSFQSPCDLIVMWDSSEVIFVGDGPTDQSGGKIYRSSNGGYNWTLVFSSKSSVEIPSMCNSVFEKNILYATEAGANFWKSSDYGISFFSSFQVAFYNWGSAVCEEDPTLILNGMYNNSCYFSLNKGDDWIYSNGTGAFAGLGLLASSKNILLNYTTGGIYKLKIRYNGIVSVDENISLLNSPSTFSLSQNYPNPFNPVTHLEFGISNFGFVTLKVYDLLGKEVKTLVNENMNPGRYKVDFDGSGLASGIYFYKIEADGFTVTKSMILLK